MAHHGDRVDELLSLSESGALASHVQESLKDHIYDYGPMSIHVLSKRGSAAWSNGDMDSYNIPVEVGCLARLINFTAVAITTAIGRLSLDEPLALDADRRILPPIQTIRLWHLLNHSDGLDGSAAPRQVPLNDAGRIDLALLLRTVRGAPAIAPPGRLYNLHAPSEWLMAGLLEVAWHRRYADLLVELLSSYANVEVTVDSNACPFSGRGILMSPKALLRLAAFHVADASTPIQNRLQDILNSYRITTPSWMLEASEASPGWVRWNGGALVAHGKSVHGALTLLADQASSTVALVHTKRPRLAPWLARAVFGSFWDLKYRMQNRLTDEEWYAKDLNAYSGTYQSAAGTILIVPAPKHRLEMIKDKCGPNFDEVRRYKLVPHEEDLFVPERNGVPSPLHLAFLDRTSGGNFGVISTAERPYRRMKTDHTLTARDLARLS
jgi:hypothetical protein